MDNSTAQIGEDLNLRRGPWTVDEDLLLMKYVTDHGEGRWNSLARSAGLRRTGKSCRLRWLNYLRPDVRRGNITLEEQLTILQLHSQLGNRWSKIAQHLPGRTDNEIKNYWRTRVQKHAKQLRCDVNSKLFRDTMRYLWIPRLTERIHATTAAAGNTSTTITANSTTSATRQANPTHFSDYSGAAVSSDTQQSPTLELGVHCTRILVDNNYSDSMVSPMGHFNQSGLEFQDVEQTNMWLGNEDFWENLWNVGDMCFTN